MDKITINGEEWIRLHDMCDILRHVASVGKSTKKAIEHIANLMFYDQIQAAETDEDREAARELPGDFIVVKRTGRKSLKVFEEWNDHRAMIGNDLRQALYFEYKSMADQVAEKLGEGWQSICMGVEDGRIIKRIMATLDDAIKEGEKAE